MAANTSPLALDSQTSALFSELLKLRADLFYGKITIIYENGIIQKMVREESIKLPRSDKPLPGMGEHIGKV